MEAPPLPQAALPVLGNPFHEQIFPDSQSKPLLEQLEAIFFLSPGLEQAPGVEIHDVPIPALLHEQSCLEEKGEQNLSAVHGASSQAPAEFEVLESP